MTIASRYPNRFTLFGSLAAPEPAMITPELARRTLSRGIYYGISEQPLYQPRFQGMTPNDPVFRRIYPVLAEFRAAIMFHPGSPLGMEEAVWDHPNNVFLFHGPQTARSVGTLMSPYPNVYFTVDFALMLEPLPAPPLLSTATSAQEFVTSLRREFDSKLERAVSILKPIIEAHPDRFMWGTDLVEPWHYDQQVVDEVIKFSRAFLGRLDPQVAEKVAHKNAEAFVSLLSGPKAVDRPTPTPTPTPTPAVRVNRTTHGHITWDEVWRNEMHVTGDIIVHEGAPLTIEPGTTVIIAAHQDAGNIFTEPFNLQRGIATIDYFDQGVHT